MGAFQSTKRLGGRLKHKLQTTCNRPRTFLLDGDVVVRKNPKRKRSDSMSVIAGFGE